MTAWKRTVQWADWNGDGLECLSILHNDEGVLADGIVTGHFEASKYDLTYRLMIDPHWRVREVRVQIANGPRLHILSDGCGRWVNENGSGISGLARCIDVDIAATPFTNTLPIRRLEQKTGVAQDINAAYVSVPDLIVEPVKQRYTKLAGNRFLYEGISTGFSAELEVDGDGIVLDYPGVFRRLS
ncbi:putative glycolipid-binding domain-containing protein [Rhizobium sp. ZK1]|uniref:putative glycolipid-binding domain-containing protein n=1 Tax=Rhizobium sp. ZK1 TaxID=3389872 RepID=UPI0039F73935